MHTLLELIDTDISNIPIYIINVKKQKKRLEHTLKELKKLSFHNINIIEAVESDYAQTNMHQFFSYKVYNNINNPINTNIIPTWSAAACAISHLKTWLKIIQSNHRIAIICEDDIIIKNPDILKFFIIESKLKAIKTDDSLWFFNAQSKYNYHNYYYTSHYNSYYNSYYNLTESNGSFQNLYNTNTCLIHSHFYLTTQSALIKMINNFYPIEYQIDIHMTQILKNKCKLNIMYSVNDCCIYQDKDKFPSTIQLYTFKNDMELWNCLDNKLPEYNCKLIYEYMSTNNYEILNGKNGPIGEIGFNY
jgi:GR25 family glycosyltransferase involved in LPS biosynthesis